MFNHLCRTTFNIYTIKSPNIEIERLIKILITWLKSHIN